MPRTIVLLLGATLVVALAPVIVPLWSAQPALLLGLLVLSVAGAFAFWNYSAPQPPTQPPAIDHGEQESGSSTGTPTPTGANLPRRMFLAPVVSGVVGFAVGQWWPWRLPLPFPSSGRDPGQAYYEASKLRGASSGKATGGGTAFKANSGTPTVELPIPSTLEGLSLGQAIGQRKSTRTYSGRPLTLQELSQLLFAAAGITRRGDTQQSSFRAAPSAGALYPIELYLAASNVTGLPRAVYHYDSWTHRLETIKPPPGWDDLARAGLSQNALRQAAAVLLLTGVPSRSQWRYGDRTQRYMLLEAGHISENIYLSATALRLGVCGIGAFLDDELNRLLGIDGQREMTLFLVAIGHL